MSNKHTVADMTRSVEERLLIGMGAMALLVLGVRALRLLLAGAILTGKTPPKSGVDRPDE